MTTLALARDNGRFRVGPLLPGEYTLWVQPGMNDGVALISPLMESVSAGAVGVELRLAVGARLEVRTVEAATGVPLAAETTLSVLGGGGESRSGGAKRETTFTNLVPGRYTVRSTSVDGWVGEAEVELRSGQEQKLEVALSPGAVETRTPEPVR